MHTPRISNFLLALLSLPVFAVLAMPAQAEEFSTCRWDGTSPFCAGSCRGYEDEMRRNDSGQIGGTPGFGIACTTGSRALCCTKCPSGLVRRDEGYGWDKGKPTPCVTPAQRAAYHNPAQKCDEVGQELAGLAKDAQKLGCSIGSTDPNIHAQSCRGRSTQDQAMEVARMLGAMRTCKQEAAANKVSPPIKALGKPKTATVNGDVNVHAGPSGDTTILGILRKTSQVTYFCYTSGDKNGWCTVRGDAVPTGSGYVWRDFLDR